MHGGGVGEGSVMHEGWGQSHACTSHCWSYHENKAETKLILTVPNSWRMRVGVTRVIIKECMKHTVHILSI